MTSQADHDRLVKLLAGPTGPELTCEQCFEQLDRYVEFEIAGAEADREILGMHAHLEGCPACAEDHASLLTFVAQRLSEAG